MVFTEYREQVKRTLPSLGSVILDSVHMVLGMCSELYELDEGLKNGDEINVAEELTDIAWYATNYLNVKGITFPVNQLVFDRIIEVDANLAYVCLHNLTMKISELQDYDKKELCYNRAETEKIRILRIEAISNILMNLNSLYFYLAINPEQAMQNNIDKLRARYPEKFNEQAANNRDLLKERKELEK